MNLVLISGFFFFFLLGAVSGQYLHWCNVKIGLVKVENPVRRKMERRLIYFGGYKAIYHAVAFLLCFASLIAFTFFVIIGALATHQ
mgnify:CR=1